MKRISLALLTLASVIPMTTHAGMTAAEVKIFEEFKYKAENGRLQFYHPLALCYNEGLGVAQDHVAAANWFRKAATQGHAAAQYSLGVCYETGRGVDKNLVESAKWYLEAAEAGHSNAQYNMGNFYRNGTGVAKNDIEAYAYYKLAQTTDELARENISQLKKRMSSDSIFLGEKRAVWLQKEIEAKKAAKAAGK